MSQQFFEDYFQYVGLTEAPIIYHRWMAIATVAAYLGRTSYISFGHTRLYPNMYILLEGSPGARKSSSMRPARNILKQISFAKLAPDRLSAERFLAEMQSLNAPEQIEGIDFERLNFETPSEIFVMASELQDFIGVANLPFVTLLTNLWDNLDEYKHPKLHGKSVYIFGPTVNMVAAGNQQSIADSIPIQAVGQGFTSRVIFVHADPTGKKIWPIPPVNQKAMDRVCEHFLRIKDTCNGEITIASEASLLLDRVYKEFTPLDDFRFFHYNTRRFDHILKLCIVFARMDFDNEVRTHHVLQANTLLHYTEQKMPKALGEFGKAKNADVANAVVEFVKTNFEKTNRPAAIRTIYKQVSTNLNKWEDLIEIIRSLEMAEKIQQKEIAGVRGYVPKTVIVNEWKPDLLLPDFLRKEELL